MSNFVLTSYFNYTYDPQRKDIVWSNDINNVLTLINSVVKNNLEIKLFHNCFDDLPEIPHCEFIKVSPYTEYTPNVARWIHYYQYLKNLKIKPNKVFMVDSTDVEMINNPFPYMQNKTIYTGSEIKKTMRNKWLYERIDHLSEDFKLEYNELIMNKTLETDILINCGLFGAEINLAIEFLEKLSFYHKNISYNETISLDTPIYIYTLLKHFSNSFVTGNFINTRFGKNEYIQTCWWKHK
jgi:hypothetical protein